MRGLAGLRPILAMAILLAALSPSAANAGIKCKTFAVWTTGLTDDAAVTAWSNKVRKAYGPAWANYNLARDRTSSSGPGGVLAFYTISGYPCRRT